MKMRITNPEPAEGLHDAARAEAMFQSRTVATTIKHKPANDVAYSRALVMAIDSLVPGGIR